ncbi:hypothetical protein P22_1705 [Propionispora sp. 2/2-37]|uniref:flagellar hook-length control protein FliK n=1 Tax=Propionispora sp. 2/2-37 TaxID=1677858 RepID=UPI0006BB828F|nr:flagellar hook-length control protein FliK [Propionispora sp. 2/2-37]CUH95631.1 hypothetical protein P22_1705 [Propionispora sp. 2/2-37]
MKINNILPGQAQAVPEATEQVPTDALQPKGEQQVTQETKSLKVDLMGNGAIGELLKQLGSTLKNNESLLKSLPSMLQQEIQRLMEQMAPDAAAIFFRGMTAVTQEQRNMIEKLQYLLNSLQGATLIQQQDSPEVVQSLVEKINTYIAAQEQQTAAINQTKYDPVQVLREMGTGTIVKNEAIPVPAKITNQIMKTTDAIVQYDKPVEAVAAQQQTNPATNPAPANLLERNRTIPQGQDQPDFNGRNSRLSDGGEPAVPEMMKVPLPAEKNIALMWMNKFQTFTTRQEPYGPNTRELGKLLAQYNDMTSTEKNAVKQLLNAVSTDTFPAKKAEQWLQFLIKNQASLPIQSRAENGATNILNQLKNVLSENVQKMVPVNGKSEITKLVTVNTETIVLLAKTLVSEGNVPPELRKMLAAINDMVTPNEQDLVNRVSSYFQTGMPQVVIQASAQFDLPELLDLWILMKFRNASEWVDLPAETLQKAIHTVKEFSTSMQNAVAAYTERSDNSNTLSFTLPLYFGNGETVYPAYVRIYHEKEKTAGNSLQQAETWLRVFFDTDYIGSVNLIFHMYQGNMLSVRTEFSSEMATRAFQQQMDELRSTLSDLPIHLADFSIRTMPEEIL